MAGIDNLRNNEEFRNHVSAQVALQKFGEAILPYRDSVLKTVHQNAGQLVVGQPACGTHLGCSNGYKNRGSLRGWCGACLTWKTQLEAHHVNSIMIQWQKQDSSSWPNTFEDIAGIFLKDGQASAQRRDLSSILGILINCNLVPLAIVPELVAIRHVRNRTAHPNVQTTHSLSSADKTTLFGRIRTVVNEPTVRNTIVNFNDFIQELTRLQNNDLYRHESEMQKFLEEVRQEQMKMNKQIYLVNVLIFFGLLVACMSVFRPWNLLNITWFSNADPTSKGHSSPQNVTVYPLPVLPSCGDLEIKTRKDWGARPPKEVDYIGTPLDVVLVHHAAMGECSNLERCSWEVRSIQNLHMDKNGWADIAYNFLISEDATVFEGRGWDREGAHSKGWNKVAVSVCFMGDYRDRLPPEAALEVAKALVNCGVEREKVSRDYRLYGHRDVRPTEGPGQRLYDEIRTWPHYDSNKPLKPTPKPYNGSNN